jgi:hypothetical protein
MAGILRRATEASTNPVDSGAVKSLADVIRLAVESATLPEERMSAVRRLAQALESDINFEADSLVEVVDVLMDPNLNKNLSPNDRNEIVALRDSLVAVIARKHQVGSEPVMETSSEAAAPATTQESPEDNV